jgi:nitrate/TMAO reductase-like tetraheme cytochrome c subunit
MDEEEPRSRQRFADSVPEGSASPAPALDSGSLQEEPKSSCAGKGPPPHKRRRIRRRRLVLIILGVVVVFIVGGALGAAEYTGRSSFCRSCHEMEAYYQDWQVSTHAEAQCRDCHIPPGLLSFVKTKLFSFREIWVHITGTVTPPLGVTRDIPDANCLACHSKPGDPALADTSFSHSAHADLRCVNCHVRVVHRDINPPYYVGPATKPACLVCHDGKTAPDRCSYCHTPSHSPMGECDVCHTQQSWTGASFTHAFALSGAHASLACADCHVTKPGVGNIPGTQLPRADPACVSCHGDEHGGLIDCASCHTPERWTPATFTHPRVGEHVPGGEARLDCASCHKSGFASYSCTPCHSGTPGGD